MTITTELAVCDYCTTEAYDNGSVDYDDQIYLMTTIGDEVSNHLCILTAEVEECLEYNMKCFCKCNEFNEVSK